VFVRREDVERFIAELRGDDPAGPREKIQGTPQFVGGP